MRFLYGLAAFALLALSPVLPASAMAQALSYVATTGSDSYGDGSLENPFWTIQEAIDGSQDGDTVVVLKGRYTGPGNTDLNFHGKGITVRSRDPEDDACVRATIVDAQGRGAIVRFVNDEGPNSVFSGFSLIAGDTSVSVRGVPGFFEFSDNARPTTRRLRIVEEGSPTIQPQPQSSLSESQPESATGLPYGGRLWDGNNPFHQPASTTDYYGSGDVDADGVVHTLDSSLAQDMADGLAEPSSRADVDGSGVVDVADVELINGAISGAVLPGWWNHLTNPQQRSAWITGMMQIDQTDAHPYQNWFQCFSFAIQTHVHGAFYRGDLSHTLYDGGPTIFNVPLYYASVSAPSFGHGINSVLIGDDPLDFDDWRFVEPQTDYDVHPGMWDMPYGSEVRIWLPTRIYEGAASSNGPRVIFFVDETGWFLQDHSTDFITARPTPSVEPPDNRPDLWNPRIIPVEPPLLLYERSREDLSRMTDIHAASLPFIDPPEGTPVVLSPQYSRLLDVFEANDGTIHLLWKGKDAFVPGVFHGTLDPLTRQIADVTRVSSGARRVRMGRVVGGSEGEVHVFWLERQRSSIDPYENGIYWNRKTESGWQGEINLAPYPDTLGSWLHWHVPDFRQYYFDVDFAANGDLILVWSEPIYGTHDAVVYELRYDGAWGAPIAIDTTNARGAEVSTDSAGTTHLAYWLSSSITERGIVVHRTLTGDSWSAPETVDGSGGACCPRMVSGNEGEVYLIWEKEVDGTVIPAWNKYANGAWHDMKTLDVRPDADAWYPTADLLPDGSLVIAWSSRSSDRVTIETGQECSDGIDNDADGSIDWNGGPLGELADPGCASASDASEEDESGTYPCDNGLDDETIRDSFVDFRVDGSGDPGCYSPSWGTESPQCQDGKDNDGDGTIDYDGGLSALGYVAAEPDPFCAGSPWQNRESESCGLGAELALLLPPLIWVGRRRWSHRLRGSRRRAFLPSGNGRA